MGRTKIKIGDRIKFRAVTRSSASPAVRKVVGFDDFGRPLVRYHGWSDFTVRQDEIIDHIPQAAE